MIQKASQWVIDGMQACIPPGCPLPFSTVTGIVSAKKLCVVATVEMFDGLPGTLEVSQHQGFKSWILCWKDLPGGAINWNGARWERANKIIQPKQLELELAV